MTKEERVEFDALKQRCRLLEAKIAVEEQGRAAVLVQHGSAVRAHHEHLIKLRQRHDKEVKKILDQHAEELKAAKGTK